MWLDKTPRSPGRDHRVRLPCNSRHSCRWPTAWDAGHTAPACVQIPPQPGASPLNHLHYSPWETWPQAIPAPFPPRLPARSASVCSCWSLPVEGLPPPKSREASSRHPARPQLPPRPGGTCSRASSSGVDCVCCRPHVSQPIATSRDRPVSSVGVKSES